MGLKPRHSQRSRSPAQVARQWTVANRIVDFDVTRGKLGQKHLLIIAGTSGGAEEYAARSSDPPAVPQRPASRIDHAKVEKQLRDALQRHEGNISAVGREMGKARMQIRRWIRMFGLDLASYGGRRRHPQRRRAQTKTGQVRLSAEDATRVRRLWSLLKRHRGNVVAVSQELGVQRTQLYRWLRRYGLDAGEFRG